MKPRNLILPILTIAAGCLIYAFAGNSDKITKVKPSTTVGSTQEYKAPQHTTQRLSAAEDGAPYGLHLVEIDNKDVTLRWNTPEATNGYFEDFESHPDFLINSPGNIGWS